MIKLTKIHGECVYINENNIQWIESTPDTVITFINGNRFIVKETILEVLNIIERQNIKFDNYESNSLQESKLDPLQSCS
jgi:flagellar protein FlbD